MVLRLKTKKESTSTSVEPRLLRVNEAAAYLSTTIWNIRTLVWERQLAPVRIGKSRRLLFDRADLDRYVESQKRVAA